MRRKAAVTSLKVRMMLAFLMLSLLVVTLLWGYQQFFLARSYVKTQGQWLKTQVEVLAEHINSGDAEKVEAMLDNVFVDSGASVEWYNGEGSLVEATLTSSKNGKPGNMGKGPNALVAPRLMSTKFGIELAEHGAVLARGPFSRVNTDVMIYARKLSDGGLVLGILPITAIDAAVGVLQGQLVWVSLILGLTSMAIGVVMATQITKPVAVLEASVKQMATGDFSVRVKESGSQELVSLAQSVNHMAQELGQMDKLKDELIANVSHELRTPLGIIKGYAEMLVDIENLSDEDKRKHLLSISDEASQLGNLVHTLLDVSQIKSGTMQLNVEAINLAQIIEETAGLFGGMAKAHGVTLEVMPSEGGALVNSDPLRLKQIIKNVLDNGIKFTPAGGTVWVQVQEAKVNIKDSGIGIAESELSKIWERHYQSEPSLKGAGIGLTLVKSLCDLLNIEVKITSVLGEGTQVELTFESFKN